MMSNQNSQYLFHSLEKSKTNKILFISGSSAFDIDNLIEERKKLLPYISFLNKKNVALIFRENLNLVRYLILLDGIVSSIIIIPIEVSKKIKNELLKKSGTQFIFYDNATLNFDIESHNINYCLKKRNDNQINYLKSKWLITTSGTTGSPKLVVHDLKSLTISTKTNDQNAIWGLLYRLEKFAGLQVFLQSYLSNSCLIIPQSNESLDKSVEKFNENYITHLSGTPSLWRKLLMLKKVKLNNLKNITLGGEVVKENILSALKKKFPKAKIRHIYASSEAGVGFSVTDGLAGFPKSYIEGSYKNLKMKISKNSTLLIKSNSNAKDYYGDDKIKIEDGYIDTGDLIEIKNNRYYFIGRENGSINIGGNKVSPEALEEFLENYPNVQMAKITPRKSSIMGNLLEATLIISRGVLDEKKFISELREHCIKNLNKEMIPSFFYIKDSIELSSSGKLKRNE